jgi:hypothetical protein
MRNRRPNDCSTSESVTLRGAFRTHLMEYG